MKRKQEKLFLFFFFQGCSSACEALRQALQYQGDYFISDSRQRKNLQLAIPNLQNKSLANYVGHGIGFHHAGNYLLFFFYCLYLKIIFIQNFCYLIPNAVSFFLFLGLAYNDRNIIGKLFRAGHLKALVRQINNKNFFLVNHLILFPKAATTTLAQGVNLPAACVIIKGTERYEKRREGSG